MDPRARLRVLFITEEDPLYVGRFFETFLDQYPRDEIEVSGITVSSAFAEPLAETARRVGRLYGPLGFVTLGGRFVVARLTGQTVAQLASARGVPLLETPSVNDPGYVDGVRRLAPDVIVSVAAPEIFGADLLASARLRCVNLHSGRLPRYRGMMPVFWQMHDGQEAAVVTAHEMVERLDAGAVLRTAAFPIGRQDSLDRVMTGTKRLAARVTIDVLRDLAAGVDRPRALDMAEARYYSFPGRADAQALRRRGHSLL